MNRNTLQTAIILLAILLIAAFILPIIFNLFLGTVWLAIRLIVLLVLIYFIVKWFRGKQL